MMIVRGDSTTPKDRKREKHYALDWKRREGRGGDHNPKDWKRENHYHKEWQREREGSTVLKTLRGKNTIKHYPEDWKTENQLQQLPFLIVVELM